MSSSTIFEYLGIADQERIHTQTLAWLLTPNSSPLKPAQRVALLSALGMDCAEEEIGDLCVQTEINSLDLVCVSAGEQAKIFLVLENKLKSRQSEHQLIRYEKNIKEVQHTLRTTAKPHKVFLTFSFEKSKNGWHDVDYASLIQSLSAANTLENVYVRDYVALLTKLINARTAFLNNPGAFGRVFQQLGWSAADRMNSPIEDAPDDVLFICRNRLERIFVETLLRNLVADIPSCYVDDTRGVPLIQAQLWLAQMNVDKWFTAGLQLQGKTLKLTIAALDYKGSKGAKVLESFGDLHIKVAGRKLRPKKGTSHDYRSWIWASPKALSTTEPPDLGFAQALKVQVADASSVWKDTLQDLQDQRKIICFEPWTADRALDLLSTTKK